MADNDSKLPIRSLAADNTTEVADSTGTTINPAREDGHLATIDTTTAEIATDTDKLDVNLSTRVADTTITARLNTLGQKTMANSAPVVIASDQAAIPVTISGTATEGTEDFKHAVAIASNASDTHSLTPGSTILLDSVDFSASGQAKVEVQWGTTGSEASKWVGFTSKGHLFVSMRLPNPVSITSAMTIKVICTNTDNQAQDLYSTIFAH